MGHGVGGGVDGKSTVKMVNLVPESSIQLCLCVCLCRGTEHKTKPDGIHHSQTHMLIRSLEISRKFHTLFGS